MKPLRLVLLECRTALRRADPQFAGSGLGDLLDEAIIEVGEREARGDTPEVRIPETHAAQQVAYAWQVAARELRFSHPELHAQLTEKVRKLLDVEVLDDPAVEIQRLQALNTAAVLAADGVRRELEELRQALADAVPDIDAKVPAAEAARLRMRTLIDAGSRGSGLPPPAHKTRAEPADLAPTREILQAVAEGKRSLTREEREWCVTEAMVRTDFQRTPVQLLDDGEPALARLLLDGAPLAGQSTAS
jgi:hypothetical protein